MVFSALVVRKMVSYLIFVPNMEMGVNKSDIVIGTTPERVRAYTGFAVA